MTTHTFKTSLFLSAGVLVAGAALPALAQPAIEEIIVTARQRAESLQDVPASITALTASQLQAAGVERAADFIALTPGVTIVNAAETADSQVNIRGINGARDAENNYALIIDGILHTNPAALNREYSDLRQIEVLKGPQGALYGRNAAAGAIIVTTQRPGNETEGSVRLSAAEDQTYFGGATISAPLSDRVFAKLHADWRTSDGFYRNTFLDEKNVDDSESYNVDGRLVFDLTDTSSLDLKAHYGDVKAAAITFNSVFHLPVFAAVFGLPQFDEDVNQHQFVFQPNIDPENNQRALEFSAKYDAEMDWGSLTAWMLYSDINNNLSADGTSGAFNFFNTEPTCLASVANLFAQGVQLPLPTFLGPTPGLPNTLLGAYTPTTCDGTQYQERNQNDISAEIRFSSRDDQPMRWTVGAYFLDLNRQVGVNLGIDRGQGVVRELYQPQNSTNPTEALVHDDFDSRVYAGFGQVAYDIQDNVEASLALRYDREERDVRSLVPTAARTQYLDFTPDGVFGGNAPLNPALNPAINPTGTLTPKSANFEQLQPKVSLTWQPIENWTMYANWGIGFKSGGFNSQGSEATVDLFFNDAIGANLGIEDQFRKERSSAFEAGFKSRFLDNRVAINGAAYYTEVKDMQFFEFLVGPFGLLRVVSNLDKVEIKGAELGVTAQVNEYFTVYGGGNMLDSKIKEAAARPDTVGNESPYTADYTLNLGAELHAPVTADLGVFARTDWNLVGPTWFHAVQCQPRPTIFGVPSNGCTTQRNSYDILDLRFGIEGPNWSVVAFAKNLTNEQYDEEIIPAPEFGGTFDHPGSLRRIGVEMNYSF